MISNWTGRLKSIVHVLSSDLYVSVKPIPSKEVRYIRVGLWNQKLQICVDYHQYYAEHNSCPTGLRYMHFQQDFLKQDSIECCWPVKHLVRQVYVPIGSSIFYLNLIKSVFSATSIWEKLSFFCWISVEMYKYYSNKSDCFQIRIIVHIYSVYVLVC